MTKLQQNLKERDGIADKIARQKSEVKHVLRNSYMIDTQKEEELERVNGLHETCVKEICKTN